MFLPLWDYKYVPPWQFYTMPRIKPKTQCFRNARQAPYLLIYIPLFFPVNLSESAMDNNNFTTVERKNSEYSDYKVVVIARENIYLKVDLD